MLKLYVREPNSPEAISAVQHAASPLVFTDLHKLEMLGSIRCSVKRGTLTQTSAAQALRLFRRDLKSEVYVRPVVDWPRVYARAHRLSQSHSRSLLVRSLDLLHVACALELRSLEFLTFDGRQKQVARAVGLLVN